MKAPKVLPYTWVDLTSTEEIDQYYIDKIRQCLLNIRAHSAFHSYVYLRRLFDELGEYLVNNPKSDASVILARLVEGLPSETLKSVTAFNMRTFVYIPDASLDTRISLEQFLIMVTSSFIKSPVPVVVGDVPRINL
jgi:hypothetical protein